MGLFDFLNVKKETTNKDFAENAITEYLNAPSEHDWQYLTKMDKEMKIAKDNFPMLINNPSDVTSVTMYSAVKINCYNMFYSNDTLRNTISVFTREIFKNGYEIEPIFFKKCKECEREYKTDIDVCRCGSKEFISPDKKQKERAEAFCQNSNINYQNIIDVLKECEVDLDVLDDAYIYTVMNDNELSAYRLNPINILPNLNDKGVLGYDNTMKPLLFCKNHRTQLQESEKCSKCGEECKIASYKTIDGLFYNQDELINLKKFSSGVKPSYPPVLTLWNKLYTLLKMDEYISKWYAGQRAPKGILVFNAQDKESIYKQLEERKVKQATNPHDMMTLVNETSQPGDYVKYIELSQTPAELQTEESRDRMRRIIGAFYGVLPLYLGNIESSGGLNNESRQITVTRDALIASISMYDRFFDIIEKKLEITDYNICIKLPDELKLKAKFEIEKNQLEIAKDIYSLGYDVKYDEDAKDWVIDKKRDITPSSIPDYSFDSSDDVSE